MPLFFQLPQGLIRHLNSWEEEKADDCAREEKAQAEDDTGRLEGKGPLLKKEGEPFAGDKVF